MNILQEHVALSETHPFLIQVFDQADLSYPFHRHEEAFELTVTLGLSGTRMVGDQSQPFGERDAVLLAPGLPHCWQDHGLKTTNAHKVMVIHFTRTLIPHNQKMAPHFSTITKALSKAIFGLSLSEAGISKLIPLMDGLSEKSSLDQYIQLLSMLDLFGNEGCSQRICSLGYRLPEPKKEEKRLEKALKVIHSNYANQLCIGDVAAAVHMTDSAFSHFFKKRTLKSFTEYVIELKLGKSARLLQLSDWPISRVGVECGFNNNSYFVQAFKKKYNTTPLRYRKTHHQNY